MITAGIDAGAKMCKVVILKDGKVIATAAKATGIEEKEGIEAAFQEALKTSKIKQGDLNNIVSTGMGAALAEVAKSNITINIADAKGMNSIDPSVKTIIDIGAEEGRVIITDKGRVTSYVLNDRCAAGAGTFVDAMARILEVDVDKFGKLALESNKPVEISAQCTVFAESEVISLVSSDSTRGDIANAIVSAIAERTNAMALRLTVEPEVALIGGTAKNSGFAKALKKALGVEKLIIPENPEFVGALGAAIIAAEKA
jgi:predicted CoA-substrate-specific enzyme activase